MHWCTLCRICCLCLTRHKTYHKCRKHQTTSRTPQIPSFIKISRFKFPRTIKKKRDYSKFHRSLEMSYNYSKFKADGLMKSVSYLNWNLKKENRFRRSWKSFQQVSTDHPMKNIQTTSRDQISINVVAYQIA